MDKKKTGILTLSSAQNYGAVLQCHSLCKYLNGNFSETEIIDFTPKFIIGRYSLIKIDKSSIKRMAKTTISSILNYPMRRKKYNRFLAFRKKNSKYGNIKYVGRMINDDYNQYIVGSDQVFNLELTRYDEEYFLPRVLDKSKKATYAASLGVSELSGKQAKVLKSGLEGFGSLSFRESIGCNLIRALLPEKNIERMIDPVFLNDKEYWEQVAEKRQYRWPYILIYAFVDFEKAYFIAKKLKSDCNIVLIHDAIKKRKPDVINARGVGPKEFLSLIKYADYIITDSFHGTAFSVIFNKEFYAIPYKGTESRFFDMLDLFNLRGRIVEETERFNNGDQIDYTVVNEVIKEQQHRAKLYFDKIYK